MTLSPGQISPLTQMYISNYTLDNFTWMCLKFSTTQTNLIFFYCPNIFFLHILS